MNENSLRLFEFDNDLRSEYPIICGVDEAGRGPLAGDVFAAAVIFGKDTVIDGINDSKKLSEKRREQLANEICAKAKAVCVASATVDEIEKFNILGATMLAMQRAVKGAVTVPDIVLVDGNRLPKLKVPTKAIVKGDAKSASIAAASILAKVARDKYMLDMAEKYPQYCFEKHKGYPTKLHYEKIAEFGICEIHRKGFKLSK